MNLKSHHNMRGIILMPILFTLSLVAVVAVMIVKQSNIETENIIRGHAPIQVKYSGLAGLEIGEEELKKDLDCENFSVNSPGSFAGMAFNSSVAPTSGSPVTLSVVVDPAGEPQTFTREVTMFDISIPAPDLYISPSAGSYIRSDNKDTNYSTANTFHVKHNVVTPDRVTLFKFDLSSVDIPVEYIISATLELHLSGSPDNFVSTVNVNRLVSDWNETEVTYNERVSGVAWSTSDIALSSSAVVDENSIGWKQFDVTELVMGWLNGDFPNYGLELQAQFLTSNNLEFISENNSDVLKHPVLKIKYACECGQTCDVKLACNGDYIPNIKESEIDSEAFGGNDISGLSFLKEGASFNNEIAPSGGAWLSLDRVKRKIYMTDMSGIEITNISTPGISPSGVTAITGGTYANHFAVTDEMLGRVSILDQTGAVVDTLTGILGVTAPVDVNYISRSATSTYNDTIAILNENGVVVVIDQAGTVIHSVDLSASGLNDPQGIVHLLDTDMFLIVDRGLKLVIKFNMSAHRLAQYSLSSFGADSARAIAINSENCHHVIAEDGLDKILSLTISESGGTSKNVVINPTEDTYIDDYYFYRGKNYGSETVLETGYDWKLDKHRSLLKFDVSSIPTGATINSVKLRLYPHVQNIVTTKLNVHKALTDWSETTAKWNNMGDNEDIDATIQGSLVMPFYSSDWQEISLPTGLIDEWMLDTSVQDKGLIIDADYGNFISKSRQSGSFFSPQLEIDYTAP